MVVEDDLKDIKQIKWNVLGLKIVEYGGVRVEGMCPHQFYLGTCTCTKLVKQYAA